MNQPCTSQELIAYDTFGGMPTKANSSRTRRMNISMRCSNAKRMKHVIAIAIVCSFLLVLPSCIPILRRPSSAPPLPTDFSGVSSQENSSQIRIEEFYDDPLLTCLIDQALVGNQELRI